MVLLSIRLTESLKDLRALVMLNEVVPFQVIGENGQDNLGNELGNEGDHRIEAILNCLALWATVIPTLYSGTRSSSLKYVGRKA